MGFSFILNWKRFAWLEIFTSVINTIITGRKTTSLTGESKGFLQILLLIEFFGSFWIAYFKANNQININKMFLLVFRIVLCKKCSEHLRDCSRMKDLFLEFAHFCMRIKKNYVILKKNPSLWDGNHNWTPINKLLRFSQKIILDIFRRNL